MGIKHNASYRSGENMAKKTDEELYDVAIKYDRKRCEASGY